METLWNSIENGFMFLGLNTPISRFGAVFIASSLAEYFVYPGYAYDSDGMRPPFFLDGEAGTYIPALIIPFLLAMLSATIF